MCSLYCCPFAAMVLRDDHPRNNVWFLDIDTLSEIVFIQFATRYNLTKSLRFTLEDFLEL